MRIGELAERIGVSTDTVRFYERSGWLPQADRRDNGYRAYSEADVDHLRLLIDLRRLDLPLEEAGRIASWCHSGHCAETTTELPRLLAERRARVREQLERLAELDVRLATLERHVRDRSTGRPALAVLGSSIACCDAAGAVSDATAGGCACCASPD